MSMDVELHSVRMLMLICLTLKMFEKCECFFYLNGVTYAAQRGISNLFFFKKISFFDDASCRKFERARGISLISSTLILFQSFAY